MLSNGKIFAPTPPQLTITKLVTQEDLKHVAQLLSLHFERFVQYEDEELGGTVVTDETAAYHGNGISVDRRVYAEIGDYLVVSDNGIHYLTSDHLVRFGILNDFPFEMFIPFMAEAVNI